MREKVRFLVVAQKAWLLLRARVGIYALYGLGFFCLIILPHLFFAPYDPEVDTFPTQVAFSVLINLTLVMTLHLSMQHFTIASCRNTTSFFSQRVVATFFKYLLAGFAMGAIALISMVISGIPFAVVLLTGVFDTSAPSIPGIILLLLSWLVMIVGTFIPVLRLWPIFPAIAMADDWSYTEAWRMTKGYTWKLLLMMFAFMVPHILLGIIMEVAWGDLQGQVVLFNAVYTGVSAVFAVLFTVYYGVLYQDLLTGYRGATASAVEPDFILDDGDDVER